MTAPPNPAFSLSLDFGAIEGAQAAFGPVAKYDDFRHQSVGMLARAWSDAAASALERGEPVLAWASESTLVAAAPAGLDLERVAERAALERGAVLRAAVYPAGDEDGGVHWTMYRRWLREHVALDGGQLEAIAFCNPATAVRGGRSLAAPTEKTAYDDTTRVLEVWSQTLSVTIDVELFVFMGLMNGLMPESVVAAALDVASTRLTRALSMERDFKHRFAADRVIFRASIPVLVVGDREICDPLAHEFIVEGRLPERHAERLADILSTRICAPCTCAEPTRIRRILRRRGEIYSFAAGVEPADYLVDAVGGAHCAVYELACRHSTYRPTAAEWSADGWTAAQCKATWLEEPLEGQLFTVQSSGWSSHAALVWGLEIGGVIDHPEITSVIAQTVGFPLGRRLTLYAPNANTLLLTDERFDDERQLREAFAGGTLVRLLHTEALPLGTEVGFLGHLRVLEAPPLLVSIRDLGPRAVEARM